MAEASLTQILDARERRVLLQNKILQSFKNPIISFTMNIAGPEKTNPLIERAFGEGLDLITKALHGKDIIKKDVRVEITGCQAIFSVNADADELKRLCVEIEESSPMGRLFDIDVLTVSGKKLNRKNERGCIVCGAPGRTCAAGRVHSAEQLQSITRSIITDYFAKKDFEVVSSAAVESLVCEVNTTPKPGLVDCRNNGSHTDMDISSFIKSANALKPYFGRCMQIGFEKKELSYVQVFPLLKKEGLKAEQDMYSVTNGANTHKGIIYSMGILCAAYGRLFSGDSAKADIDALCEEAAHLCGESVKEDFKNATGATSGEALYIEKGITGIRGEVASGFESVKKISLPQYRKAIRSGLNPNDAGLVALLHLISHVSDTNLLKRGGEAGAGFARREASCLLEEVPAPSKAALERLDDEFIKRNLSPGGCADLLAITYFLHKITL